MYAKKIMHCMVYTNRRISKEFLRRIKDLKTAATVNILYYIKYFVKYYITLNVGLFLLTISC